MDDPFTLEMKRRKKYTQRYSQRQEIPAQLILIFAEMRAICPIMAYLAYGTTFV